jgi:uncharacterized protein
MRMPIDRGRLRFGHGGEGTVPHVAQNVLGTDLQICCTSPMTGFQRNGCCDTTAEDVGVHTICAVVTDEFLAYSRVQGNDLVTPMPEHGFPGLVAGDRWCVCAPRWKEAFDAGCAPPVVLGATHQYSLEFVTMDELRAHAVEG